MSTNPIDLIRQFNTLAGNTDDTFNVRQTALYTGLQCEELAEKLATLARVSESPFLAHMAIDLDQLADEFKVGTFDDTFASVDRLAMLDDDVDLFIVTVGALLSQGVDVDGAIAEVNRANMSKVWPAGTMHRDGNGKIVKPEGWTAPDLRPFVHIDGGVF